MIFICSNLLDASSLAGAHANDSASATSYRCLLHGLTLSNGKWTSPLRCRQKRRGDADSDLCFPQRSLTPVEWPPISATEYFERAEGDLSRASALLALLPPTADIDVLGTQVYQAIFLPTIFADCARAHRRLAAAVIAACSQRQASRPMTRSFTLCITLSLHLIARTRSIHAVSLAWCCMRISARMAHRRAGRNCTAAQKAIRAARQATPLTPLSFWVITSMRSRQAHTALGSGTTHATPPTAPPTDAWRMSLRGGPPAPRPAPQQDCPSTFANVDIFSWTSAP
jgi:hypothetical protein